MIVGERKYLSEFAVSLFSGGVMVLSASELHSSGEMPAEGQELADVCHIYLICRIPALSFDPKTFEYNGENISGHLLYRTSGEEQFIPFDVPFPLLDGATGIRISEYPHREIITFNENEEHIRHLPASALNFGMPFNPKTLRKFEVLYVGQAYADGKRSAIKRLKSHSTLQKILAEHQYKNPDDEIFLFNFEYMPNRVITSFDGRAKDAIVDEDQKRFYSIVDNPLSQHQQICLAEAGLIRYFQPPYNEIYKKSFPASDQKILNECYQLDFSALITEINTEELAVQLYSKSVPAWEHHTAQFDLVDPEERRSFFTFVDADGEAFTPEDVIPRTR